MDGWIKAAASLAGVPCLVAQVPAPAAPLLAVSGSMTLPPGVGDAQSMVKHGTH